MKNENEVFFNLPSKPKWLNKFFFIVLHPKITKYTNHYYAKYFEDALLFL